MTYVKNSFGIGVFISAVRAKILTFPGGAINKNRKKINPRLKVTGLGLLKFIPLMLGGQNQTG